jgi:2-methylisocitrate lyase-like PEP mutase family enzyme
MLAPNTDVKKNARVDDTMMIWVRTNALVSAGGGLSEALNRANAYADAGADGIKVIARSCEDLAAFAKAWGGRLLPGTATTTWPELTTKEVKKLGYAVHILASEHDPCGPHRRRRRYGRIVTKWHDGRGR